MKAEYIDHMGDDLRVVNSARVSFNKESEWQDIQIDDGGACPGIGKGLTEPDQRLIKYLATHGHWTPFSHVMITMRETVPIFVARQRFKHMVGFTYNEVSRRYVDEAPEFYEPDVWRGRPIGSVKQGSSEEAVPANDWFIEAIREYNFEAKVMYECLLSNGVAPEQARMVLPQSMYTSYYVTGSLAAWARAYKLRIDPHAQKEIQDLAKQWDEVIRGIPEMKYSWEALSG